MKYLIFLFFFCILYSCHNKKISLVGAWQCYAHVIDVDNPVYYEFYFFSDSSMVLVPSCRFSSKGSYALNKDSLRLSYENGTLHLKITHNDNDNDNYELISEDIRKRDRFMIRDKATFSLHRFKSNNFNFLKNNIVNFDSSTFRNAFYKRKDTFIKTHTKISGKSHIDTIYY
jgi:hypothetical protein